MPFDQRYINLVSLTQMSVSQMSADQMSVDQMSVDQMSVDQTSVDQLSVGQRVFYSNDPEDSAFTHMQWSGKKYCYLKTH